MKYINKYSLKEIIQNLKNYDGITRKNKIKMITNIIGDLKINKEKYITTFKDDAAAIDIGIDELLLFATDGIFDKLVNKSPWWAGYAVVLSNINDIYAMGGYPIAMVDVLSSNDEKVILEMCNGMKECLNKFNIPIVGGHTHPDSSKSSISISIVGKVSKESIIRSDKAQNGEIIIEALDLNGKKGPNSNYSWESTLTKTSLEIKKLYDSVIKIGNNKLVTSGKDISNPGVIGTIGMLCEASNVGAIIDINKILVPKDKENNFDFIEWIQTHPSSGFIFTASYDNVTSCIQILEQGGFSTAQIGIINSTKKLELKDLTDKMELFDFNRETLF